MPTSHFITQDIFKCILKNRELIKLTLFNSSSKTFLSEIDLKKKSPVYDGERHQTLVQFDAFTLIYAKAPVVLPMVDFVSLVQMSVQ